MPTTPVTDRVPLTCDATIIDARAAILKELASSESKTSAITVALVDDKRILWAEAFGSTDKTRGLAPSTETLFCIASCSKVIAAVAAMILVDRRLIELDAPLVRYLTDFRMADGEAYHDITVRMLLNHSSGLPGTRLLNVLTIIPCYGYATQVRDALANERLKHPPGEMAVYCSDGFTLMELLVAAVTGQSYTDFIRQEILEPLGMHHTRFALEPFDSGSFAPALDRAGRPEPQEYVNVYASGLYSTASDMGRLAMLFLSGGCLGERRLLSTEAVAEMGRDQTVNLPFNPITDHPVHFGLGWDGVRQGGLAAVGVTAWYKAGDADHYHSYLIVAPDERLAVAVIITNRSATAMTAGLLAEHILLDVLAERRSIASVPAPLEDAAPPTVPVSEEELAAIAGLYASSYAPRRLEPQVDRSLTLLNFMNGQWQPVIEGLKLRQDGFWVAESRPAMAYRAVVAAGRRYLSVRMPGGLGHYRMELPDSHDLPPGQSLSARWQARVGRCWLIANDLYSAFLALGRQSPVFGLVQIQGLDGYLAALVKTAGIELVQIVDPRDSDHRARMCLKIPVDNGWGLNDLVIEDQDGEEWVIWGSLQYRPLATVVPLECGQNQVTIGSDGLGQWRRLPAASSLTIAGAAVWYLYDREFALHEYGRQDKTVYAASYDTAWAYLLVGGRPNHDIRVTLG